MPLVFLPSLHHILRVLNTNIDGKRNIRFDDAVASVKTGKNLMKMMSSLLDNKRREDLECLTKIRVYRGLRHYRGVRFRG